MNQIDLPQRAPVPAQSPFQAGDWVRQHGYPGNPPGPRQWGWRGHVTGSIGSTILVGVTDDGRAWAEYWGALALDVPNDDPVQRCVCCPRISRPVQLGLFNALTPDPPSTEDTMTTFEPLTGTVRTLVDGVRQELAPQLNFIADSTDMEQLTRKIVGRVLRDLSTSTQEEFGGTESEHLDAYRLDELADEAENDV